MRYSSRYLGNQLQRYFRTEHGIKGRVVTFALVMSSEFDESDVRPAFYFVFLANFSKEIVTRATRLACTHVFYFFMKQRSDGIRVNEMRYESNVNITERRAKRRCPSDQNASIDTEL